MKALLIVDMQNDFMPGGALAVFMADKIIPIINQLMEVFDNVYATKDWHPKGHISFASSHNKKVGDVIKLKHGTQILWPDHCIQNTKGAELATGLNIDKIKKTFNKGLDKNIDSYSAFFDNDHKKSTGLDLYLRKKNINSIYMVGVATDYCVKYSAIDAVSLGYDVYLIKDGCMPIEKKQEKELLLKLERKGIRLISSKDIL